MKRSPAAAPENNLPARQLPVEAPAQPAHEPPTTPAKVPRETVLAATQPLSTNVEPPATPPKATEPTDVWERIRRGYKLSTAHIDSPRVQAEINWYTRHPSYVQRVEERAAPFLYHIVEQIAQRGMPMELALLPVVESAFRPSAYSSRRAAGIWQFIPSTGRMYSLRQNWWYDGRRDVMAATDAALDYLQSLADRFDGDWELALAAYNAGARKVRQAIRRNQKRARPTDYWSLKLPKETKGYVPRLLAFSRIVADPAKYGISLAEIPNEPYFDVVQIDTQLDLTVAAELAGISLEELQRLNPGFNRFATAPDGPHRLYLPLQQIDRFNAGLAALKPEQRLRWTRYRIEYGDSLSTIARKFGTTVAALKTSNRLRSTSILAGKDLVIPMPMGEQRPTISVAQQVSPSQTEVVPDADKLLHVVSSGDTLWDIARTNNVSHKSLANWNGISTRDMLRPGQQLVIWSKGELPSTGQDKDEANLQPMDNATHYRVRRGDSLYLIARRFNVTIADLRKWNHLPGKYLQPGQKLKVHLDLAEQSL